MLNPFKPLSTPEYFFRPSQMLVRLRRLFSGPLPVSDRVRLPWGQVISVRPREVIGAAIWYYGVFDLIVTETIHRLLDPGETALDIGANLGQMTSLMRHRCGANGRVISFEPHPELFAELSVIAQETRPGVSLAPVELHPMALSDVEGEGSFEVGALWNDNRGIGKLVAESPGTSKLKVRVGTLDQLLPEGTRIGVCKIDVEGHEPEVFRGAARLLKARAIRDIIFEDFAHAPTSVRALLQSHGFSVFSLHSSLWRPRLKPVTATETNVQFDPRDGCNYVATIDPQRAAERFRQRGWLVLKGR